ncbi:MAG: hypothetical protein AAGF88_01595 [Pseudomonadota bacterium]
MELKRIALKGGRYEGRLDADGADVPVIELVHQERVVGHAEVSTAEDGLHVTADVPSSVLSDGIQVLALRTASDGTVLDRVTFLMGSGLDGDFRSELALLRDEVELLKRAFRRHCVETGID